MVVGGDVSFRLRRQIAFPFDHLTPIVFGEEDEKTKVPEPFLISFITVG